MILLLAQATPRTELPFTRVFLPVMGNLAKAILLCRRNEAHTSELVAERNLAQANLRKAKQAGHALRESEEKFRMITAAARDAIIMVDGEGQIVCRNPAAERFFGYGHEEAMGRGLRAIIGEGSCHEAYERFRSAGEGSAVGESIELTAVRKDGSEFPVEVSISAISLGGKRGAVGILRASVEAQAFEAAADASLHITVSIGIASRPLHADAAEALVAAADRALYAAKNAGRNRVTACGEAAAGLPHEPR